MNNLCKKYLSIGITVEDIDAAILLLKVHGFEEIEMNETNDGWIFAVMRLSEVSDFQIFLLQSPNRNVAEIPIVELITVQGKYHVSRDLLKDLNEWKEFDVHNESDIL